MYYHYFFFLSEGNVATCQYQLCDHMKGPDPLVENLCCTGYLMYTAAFSHLFFLPLAPDVGVLSAVGVTIKNDKYVVCHW